MRPARTSAGEDQAQVRVADADCVLMLYRDDYYDADSERPGEMDIIVRKNRQRPGQVTTQIDNAAFATSPSSARGEASLMARPRQRCAAR